MCLIAYVRLNGKGYLAKNRDRYYITPIRVVHTESDGVEILYIHDTKSGWIEGMNEYGISIVNSVLPTTREEIVMKSKESKHSNERLDEQGHGNDGTIIFNALRQTRLQDALSVLLRCNCRTTMGLHGHTIVSDGKTTRAVEYTSKTYPVVKVVYSRYIRANHTVYLGVKHGGYNPKLNAASYQSSLVRMKEAKRLLSGIKSNREIMPKLADVNLANPCHSVFRIGHRCDQQFKYGFATTSQVMFDPVGRVMHFYVDPYNTHYGGYVDEIGKGRAKKIKFTVHKIKRKPYTYTILKDY